MRRRRVMTNDPPRRVQLNLLTTAEIAIVDALQEVEAVGADVRLTDAVVLLQAARNSVADYVDGIDKRRYVSDSVADPVALQEEIARLTKQLDTWQKAAFFKPRTWEVLQGMMRAGDSPAYLAEQYGVPVQFVEFLAFPECDLDARYGRPSDRTKTMRERAEAAEREVVRLSALLAERTAQEPQK